MGILSWEIRQIPTFRRVLHKIREIPFDSWGTDRNPLHRGYGVTVRVVVPVEDLNQGTDWEPGNRLSETDLLNLAENL
jgi:hypothetical protein